MDSWQTAMLLGALLFGGYKLHEIAGLLLAANRLHLDALKALTEQNKLLQILADQQQNK